MLTPCKYIIQDCLTLLCCWKTCYFQVYVKLRSILCLLPIIFCLESMSAHLCSSLFQDKLKRQFKHFSTCSHLWPCYPRHSIQPETKFCWDPAWSDLLIDSGCPMYLIEKKTNKKNPVSPRHSIPLLTWIPLR